MSHIPPIPPPPPTPMSALCLIQCPLLSKTPISALWSPVLAFVPNTCWVLFDSALFDLSCFGVWTLREDRFVRESDSTASITPAVSRFVNFWIVRICRWKRRCTKELRAAEWILKNWFQIWPKLCQKKVDIKVDMSSHWIQFPMKS